MPMRIQALTLSITLTLFTATHALPLPAKRQRVHTACYAKKEIQSWKLSTCAFITRLSANSPRLAAGGAGEELDGPAGNAS